MENDTLSKVRTILEQSESYDIEVNRITHALILASSVFLLLVALWMSFSHLDIVSMAEGQVIPSSQIKSVQHLEGGIIESVKVKEGQVVRKGDTLVVLESTESGSNVMELSVRMASLESEIIRLEAEASGEKELYFTEDLMVAHPDLVDQTTELFKIRLKKYYGDINAYEQKVRQRDQDIEEVGARLKNLKEKLQIIQEQIAISEELLKDQLTNRFNHLNLLREMNEVQSLIEEDTAALKRTEAGLLQAKAERDSIRNSYLEQVNNELDESRQEYSELKERLTKFEDSLQRTVLKSPVNGIIKKIYIYTTGGVLKPGETVLDIVPDNDQLIIEAQLPVSDVGFVRLGQLANISLASAEGARFDKIAGQIIFISPDTLEDEEGNTFYKVRIETDRDEFKKGEMRYKLYPGMQVVANIVTGQRTVMEYLLSPFFTSMDGALQER